MRPRDWLNDSLSTMFKKICSLLLITCILAVSAVTGYLYWQVVVEPGGEIAPENIESILGKESPVFYSDNVTQLGVFFDESHRQYVTFREIPPEFVNALVAAEDNRFFSHFGFDPVSIGRAALKNIEAGRVVQGGSTLTQQTAKNLFKRSERSFRAKLKELLFALRLEYHYPKEKIFEFYANQFYVSGNGHGLGVAARYYFDKEPSELTLVECAFIAGSVKQPNYYNPFIKKSKETADLAKERARTRLKYVLDKMLQLGMIDFATYRAALAKGIDFKQGKVGYSLDYVMEMVKDAVGSDEVIEALAAHGVDNVATSGIRVVTTVDRDLQEKALYALRHDLSRLDVMLHGYEREEVQAAYEEIDFDGDGKLVPGAFLFGVVESFGEVDKNYRTVVNFGRRIGQGLIDQDGFARLAEARVKWQQNLWAEAGKKDIHALFKQLRVGDRVWVSVRDVTEDGTILLDLEKYPVVQGGAIVLKDGMIMAMAGGTENRFYNRAVYAKRTMGSSFKPFVYAAALQLGWNSSDLLKNTRDVFVFHNQPYFPRPDHNSPYPWVSMSWAGVHSENLASVWLLAHLLDKLTFSQFKEVADYLGLTPQVVDGEEEPYKTYRTRIRDRYGIVVTKPVLRAAAFREAITHSEADFIFENLLTDYGYLKTLHYGLGFDNYKAQLDGELGNGKLAAADRSENRLRRGLLAASYLELEQVRESFAGFKARAEDPLGVFQPELGATMSLYFNTLTGNYVYLSEKMAEPHMQWVSRPRLQEILFDLLPAERERFWRQVRLWDQISVAGFDFFAEQLAKEYDRLQELPAYSLEVLAGVDDFRIYTGMRYLMALASEMGIRSKMEPILSFPLGANVTSLLETTRMYETLVTGRLTTYGNSPSDEESDSLLIIDRIESEDGRELYRPKRQTRVVLGEKSRIAVGHIMENVIKFGTGRQADKAVRLKDPEVAEGKFGDLDLAIPLLGKTGTANRYTNASFYGYLPGIKDGADGLTAQGGYAVGVYVGHDDNRAMRKGTIRITGSSGALPTWIDIVNELVVHEKYNEKLDPVDLTFEGLLLQRERHGQVNLAANQDNGGALAAPVSRVSEANRYSPSILTFGTLSENLDGTVFEPERAFEPFWKMRGDTVVVK